ncbi:metal-sensing transcriptional repressor [Phenylobacterium aquaticum]|uniref:metal-sensing transcriptional repressor n=1 Tax=Phenylobacterium aquaticum TaxID=1763816 RepID=UPI001F5D7650|nr:metal-sensing transcriptional repressor [Phenylobacterium aquaticum]MCI3130875.1 metal-sensing transcriptional repressor [Phenylobacterium aquaticum]
MISSDKARLRNRLRRLEGQIGGVTRMLDADRDAQDLLTQLQAARAALARVEAEILQSLVDAWLARAQAGGRSPEATAEMRRLLKHALR